MIRMTEKIACYIDAQDPSTSILHCCEPSPKVAVNILLIQIQHSWLLAPKGNLCCVVAMR